MKQLIVFMFLQWTWINANAYMSFLINTTPQLTPLLDEIYIAGSMNDWAEGSEVYKLTHNDDGTWIINLEGTQNETLEFKFTRGLWQKVEGNALGAYIPNRTTTFVNGTTITLTIEGWEDIAGAHTITDHVRILDTDFEMPQLNRSRRIWICFPQDYFTSDLHYPVCYMHDGQNVFDAATSFAGEWQVDENMLAQFVPDCANTIIVAIDNGGAHRLDEYAPFINAEYNEGGEGASYTAFVVETLKPFMDANFRTLSDRSNTSTAGSSLGALISMYMLIEYNNVFSKAGIFSPAFWFNPEIYDLAETGSMAIDTEIHFVCGDNESRGMVGDMQQMVDIAEVQNLDYTSTVQLGGQHNEYYWALQFPAFMDDVLSCVSATFELWGDEKILVYPNPTSDTIFLELDKGILGNVQLINAQGQILSCSDAGENAVSLNIKNLEAGVYTLYISYMPYLTSTAVGKSFKFIKE